MVSVVADIRMTKRQTIFIIAKTQIDQSLAARQI